MAQFVLPTAFMAALVTGAVVVGNKNAEETQRSDAMYQTLQESVPTASEWVFTNQANKSVCLISKVKRVSASTSVVEPDATCSSVFRDIDLVSVWQQDQDGNVTLADDKGNAIAEFSWDDNEGLISISAEPGTYALTPSS